MNSSIKIAAIGRTQMLYNSIKAIFEAGFHVPLIITCKESPEYKRGSNDFKRLAKNIGAKFVYANDINKSEIHSQIRALSPDIGISINWTSLIRESILKLFNFGIVNCHPGDLPKYKGNACPNWALINNEPKIGLTFHLMDRDLDAGNIIEKRFFFTKNSSTIGNFYRFWEETSPKVFLEIIKSVNENNFIESVPQEGEGFRCYPRMPVDSLIDWSKGADEIVRLINASSEPFTGAFTYLKSKKFIVWKAHFTRLSEKYISVPGQVASIDRKKGEVSLTCGKGYVVLQEVEYLDSGKCKPTDVITSTRLRAGDL